MSTFNHDKTKVNSISFWKILEMRTFNRHKTKVNSISFAKVKKTALNVPHKALRLDMGEWQVRSGQVSHNIQIDPPLNV